MKLKNVFAIGVAALMLATVSLKAQTTNVQNLLPPLPPGTLPAGASIPAFNTNGLDFTNADFKIASGSQFNAAGGVLTYLQFDADLYSLGPVDLGVGANGTFSGTGTGFHTAAALVELIKNFNNFQFSLKAGPGVQINNSYTVYGAQVFEIDYNLTPITSGWLAGNKLFTFVGANIEFDEGDFQTGGKFQKQVDTFVGVAF